MNLLKRVFGDNGFESSVSNFMEMQRKINDEQRTFNEAYMKAHQETGEALSGIEAEIKASMNLIPDDRTIDKLLDEIDELKRQKSSDALIKTVGQQQRDINKFWITIADMLDDIQKLKAENEELKQRFVIRAPKTTTVGPDGIVVTHNADEIMKIMKHKNRNVKTNTDLYDILLDSDLTEWQKKKTIGSLANLGIKTVSDLKTCGMKVNDICKEKRLGNDVCKVLRNIAEGKAVLHPVQEIPEVSNVVKPEPVKLSAINIKDMIWDTALPMKLRCRVLKDLNACDIQTVEDFKLAGESGTNQKFDQTILNFGPQTMKQIEVSYKQILGKAA